MRLIDADAIPELFDKEYKAIRLLIEQGEEHLDNLAEGFTEAHHVIQKMPTIEAEPVKHGRWIAKQTALGTKYTVCSNCEYGISIPINGHLSKLDLSDVPRCPNCGAKMDLEVDHAESVH